MKILSLDQSTNKSGWCLFSEEQCIKHGVIDLHKIKDSNKRFYEMCSCICKIIDAESPELLVIENTEMQGSPSVLRTLSQLQGVIMGYCNANKIKIKLLFPTEWRKILEFEQGPKVKREQLKRESVQYVKKKFKIDVLDDEADAICIGLAFIEQQKWRNK